MKFLLFVLLACFVAVNTVDAASDDYLLVSKSARLLHNGEWLITVSVRATEGHDGDAKDITIVDSVPPSLIVTSGNLVARFQQSTTAAQTVTYTLTASNQIQLSVAERSIEFDLPVAQINYFVEGEGKSINSEPTPVSFHLQIFTGNIDMTAVIAFVTLILPVLAAYVFIGKFSEKKVETKTD
eukprot:TRINITY_DN7739_c0_g1_i3.p1 TRINITY_DN7739_c0_g1~~TRINITY_DN7739_c0_g1_i3.p1  ORF type:complete len:213 (+),score=49.18 TRINITY_DN7739_c0_g1_i3:92-640(+)